MQQRFDGGRPSKVVKKAGHVPPSAPHRPTRVPSRSRILSCGERGAAREGRRGRGREGVGGREREGGGERKEASGREGRAERDGQREGGAERDGQREGGGQRGRGREGGRSHEGASKGSEGGRGGQVDAGESALLRLRVGLGRVFTSGLRAYSAPSRPARVSGGPVPPNLTRLADSAAHLTSLAGPSPAHRRLARRLQGAVPPGPDQPRHCLCTDPRS